MMSLKFFFSLSGIFLAQLAMGQHSLEFNSISGFKVFSPGNYSLSGMSIGGEVAYNFSQHGRNDEWIKRLKVSQISLVAGFHDMQPVHITDSIGSKGFLQKVFTLSGRLNHKLLELNPFSVSITTGIGLAYSTSSYFTDNNPIVGSRLNFTPQAGFKFKADVSPLLTLGAAISIFHYSNAAIRVPNNGVNSFQASLGLAYQLPVTVPEPVPAKRNTYQHFFELALDAGRRGAWRSKAGNWKSGFSVSYNYWLNSVLSLKAAADIVYYHTSFDGSSERYQYLATSLDPWRLGLGAGTNIALGQLAVGANYGYYVHYNSYHPINAYWTAGFKYYLTQRFGLQTKVYFHQTQADYVGFGVVVRK